VLALRTPLLVGFYERSTRSDLRGDWGAQYDLARETFTNTVEIGVITDSLHAWGSPRSGADTRRSMAGPGPKSRSPNGRTILEGGGEGARRVACGGRARP